MRGSIQARSAILATPVSRDVDTMRRATLRVVDEERPPETVEATAATKRGRLPIGASLLIWTFMGALAWGVIALMIRLL